MAAASRRASPTPRRVLAIKRADGEPLTRADIQFDLLQDIFSDTQEVFTDPYASPSDGTRKISFRDLYIKAILHSPKATKALKDKMAESSVFALDFAMLSLLVNVGRVNTTMSFFPEMKTTIRTYHPIPSLQHTNGNMQDAPRIKHILKTSLLESELSNPPATPAEIVSRCKVGQLPPTSVTNLVFVMAHHTGAIGQSHFNGVLDFLDIFLRGDVSSHSRAQAFLFLCFNYLEAPSSEDDYDEEPTPNPFADPMKKTSPSFLFLTADEVDKENQDSPEDVANGEKLLAQRSKIVHSQSLKEGKATGGKTSGNDNSVVGDDDEPMTPTTDEPKAKGRKSTQSSAIKGRKSLPATKDKKSKLKGEVETASNAVDAGKDDFIDELIKLPTRKRPMLGDHDVEISSRTTSHYTQRSSSGPEPSYLSNTHRHRYSPYGHPSTTTPIREFPKSRLKRLAQPRTMLQQAWHVVMSTDPLVDSDEEDEYAREDYIQRLKIINQFSPSRWYQEPSSHSLSMDTDSL
ncbi:hypothetical protein CVT24_000861 [Panaeolus cyanescens]|uniref:Ino eighty subunit 1 n=1 Tax=Panaeolus cyanescens TaxID=181874 RepID=A0A409VX03_9AGAR|nr:hypothetical protein CVT24_000861 [Panaeolus cyanescens]